VPAQIIFSGHHARINEIIPFGNLPTTVIPGAAGCGTPTCSIRGFFPRGLEIGHPQNIWTAEAQLPTPWVTFTGKYYQGGDLRFPFGGQLNDVFNDLNGQSQFPPPVQLPCRALYRSRPWTVALFCSDARARQGPEPHLIATATRSSLRAFGLFGAWEDSSRRASRFPASSTPIQRATTPDGFCTSRMGPTER